MKRLRRAKSKLHEAAMGGIIIVRYIFKAFTNALFKTYRILQIQNPVLNLATVDVPGVIISTPWRPYKHELFLFGHKFCLYRSFNGKTIFISAWALTLSVQL